MIQHLKKVIDTKRYDLLYVVHLDIVPYVLNIKNVPVVVDLVDSLSLHFLRKINESAALIDKVRMLKRWVIVRRIEQKYVRLLSKVTITSKKDEAVIKSLCPQIDTQVVANGVDLAYFNPKDVKSDEQHLLFTGNMSYMPNVNAMLYFCEKIFPFIKEKFPSLEIDIVGRNPDPKIVMVSKVIKGINIIGFVEDTRPFYERAAIFVCPVSTGAGIKNKILEAFAMKKAVVATSISCEGIQVERDKNVLIANTNKEFISNILQLLENEDLRIKLGENARELIEKQYTWDLQSKRLESIFMDAIKNRELHYGKN